MIRAAVMRQPFSKVELQNFPHPEMEEGSILLRTIYSEVCGTDVHLWHGKLSGVPYPIIPGHINVGKIEEIKGDINDVNGRLLEIGDIVTFLDVHETCYNCWFCLIAKTPNRCPYRKVYGITYSANDGLLGGWSEVIYLKPKVKIIKLPVEVSPERFIGGGCGIPTAFHAIERAEIRLADNVVVQGTGAVGLNAIIFSRLSGAACIIAIGAPQLRLEIAQKAGADHIIDISKIDPQERIRKVRELTDGRGADVTIEATGNAQAIKEGLSMTRDGGRYVIVGQYTDQGLVEINPHLDINRKHIDIRGCWGSDLSHLYKGIQIMAKYGERFPWQDFITRKYKLNEVNLALEDVENLRVVKAVIAP